MDGFIKLFEKLSNDLKIQISVVISGLLIPSLLYYVLIFPNEFYYLDLIKIIITSICINFIIIFTLLLIIIVIKYLIYNHRRKLVKDLKEFFDVSLEDLNTRSDILRKMIDDKKVDLPTNDIAILDDSDLAKLASDLDKDVLKVTKQYKLYEDYMKEFTNLGMHTFYSASSYIVTMSINCMLNLFFLIEKDFRPDALVKEVRINLIMFVLITLYFFIKEDRLKINDLKKQIGQD